MKEKLARVKGDDSRLVFWCPGCEHAHVFDARWKFNGDMDRPTFEPSLLNTSERGPERTPTRCHLYVREGRIVFLSDCTHKLAGQTVEMTEDAWGPE